MSMEMINIIVMEDGIHTVQMIHLIIVMELGILEIVIQIR